jgi:predicted double-glycine peptidase
VGGGDSEAGHSRSARPPDGWRLERALLVLLSAVMVVSSSTAGEPTIRASLAPRLVPVPLISQSAPWTCGPAALMAALVYFGVFDEAESRLDAELGATPDEGTHVRDIVAGARRFGLSAEAQTGLTLESLNRELAGGAVVIVALQAWASGAVTDWRSDWEDGHYVVVVGVTGDRVYVMDPSVRTGYAYLPRRQFLDRWHDYDVEDDHQVVWNRLGIVIRGRAALGRYPAEPTPME